MYKSAQVFRFFFYKTGAKGQKGTDQRGRLQNEFSDHVNKCNKNSKSLQRVVYSSNHPKMNMLNVKLCAICLKKYMFKHHK